MKKFLILIILFPVFSLAQIDYAKEAQTDLKKLDSIFKLSKEKFEKAKDTLRKFSDQLSPKLTDYYEEVRTLKKKTDSIYDIAKVSIAFYSQKGVDKSLIDKIIEITNYDVGIEQKTKVPKEEIFVLFGDDKLILKEKIIKDTIANEILKSVLKEGSETHFGNFWFPMDGQEIPVTTRYKKNPLCKTKPKIGKLKFDRIDIDLYEGNLRDVKVYLKDSQGLTYLFENKVSISLLKFNKLSGINYLHNSSLQSNENGSSNYECYWVRVSDVLRYFSQPGGNYVPNNDNFSFPISNKKGKTNKKASNIYELRQATSLNNVIDFRAYTDLLGLAGTNPNGIAQFEGQADFYIVPFRTTELPFTSLNPNIYFFKKIKPYVSYSRFDDEDKFLELKNSEETLDAMTLKYRMEHLQKSYLDFGIKLDVINFSLGKEFPFEVGAYFGVRYQISEIQLKEQNFNYKTFGAGYGFNFEFRRLKNLKLNYSLEFTKYDQAKYNDIDGFVDPDPFWVFRNDAEISYYPSEKINNAIFLRVRVFDEKHSDAGSNFFQIQFGYKFTLGVNKLKTGN